MSKSIGVVSLILLSLLQIATLPSDKASVRQEISGAAADFCGETPAGTIQRGIINYKWRNGQLNQFDADPLTEFDGSWDSVRTFRIDNGQPIKVYIDKNPGSAHLYKPAYAEFVRAGMQSWSDALDGRLKFAITNNPADANIKVKWVQGFSDPYQAGLAEYQPGKATIRIKTVGLPANLIKGNIMHEIGHALGISTHSNHNDDIMKSGREWASYDEYQNYQPKLSTRDILAIRRLYSPTWVRGENLYVAIGKQPNPHYIAGAETPAVLRPSDRQMYQRSTRSIQVVNFQPYIDSVNHRIGLQWKKLGFHPGGNAVVILSKINKSGELLGYEVRQSSGNRYKDYAAIKAVRNAAPFWSLPANYPRDTMNVEMVFN